MINELVSAILLGIVQGITEWLPVSSSGHLVLIQQLFNIEVSLFYDIMLHVGSVLVILLVFWKDILKIRGKWLGYLVVGSLFTAGIGYFGYDFFKGLFDSVETVGVALIVTGALLFYADKKNGQKKISFFDSILIGIMQGLAIIPGISRSGSTIAMGLFRGVKRDEIVKFSFILAIPAILGALLFEVVKQGFVVDFSFSLGVGTLVSMIVGYFSLKFLIKLVKERKLEWFAYYCFFVGGITLILSLI